MYPLKFNPVYLEKIWGGTGLEEQLGRELPSKSIGESWEIVARPEIVSVVTDGPLAGKNLTELCHEYGSSLLGVKAARSFQEEFPLLVKLLDARDILSVQVHPDDQYAHKHEEERGKFELWYVLAATSEAKIYYGLKPGVDRNVMEQAIFDGTVEDLLCQVTPLPNEVYLVPPGTVHALGAGIIVLEIQVNSNLTYRVFDYNRIGNDGKFRKLDIHKALDVINFHSLSLQDPVRVTGEQILLRSEFFNVDFHRVDNTHKFHHDGSRFYILTCVEGNGLIQSEGLSQQWKKGESFLLPADTNSVFIKGPLSFLKTYSS